MDILVIKSRIICTRTYNITHRTCFVLSMLQNTGWNIDIHDIYDVSAFQLRYTTLSRYRNISPLEILWINYVNC